MKRFSFDGIFTPEEAAAALDELHDSANVVHEPDKWLVHRLNRSIGKEQGAFKAKVSLRDITARTIDLLPRSGYTRAERHELLKALANAGAPEIMAGIVGLDRTVDDMRREVEAVKSVAPKCEVSYLVLGKAREHVAMASEAGADMVQFVNAPFLGEASSRIVERPTIYERVWRGQDWRDVPSPATADEHLKLHTEILELAASRGMRVCSLLNRSVQANEEYVARHCEAAARAGASEVTLADSTGGMGPEAIARLVEVARSSSPTLRISVHMHNAFGMANANSIAAARAGADGIEVAVSGLEAHASGCQASLAATAVTLEGLYGIDTGIDLSKMAAVAELVAKITGWPIPWNEAGVGDHMLVAPLSLDLVEGTHHLDPFTQTALKPEALGAVPQRAVALSTGPLAMWSKLGELGIDVGRDQVQSILDACKAEFRRVGRPLNDDEIREVARRTAGVAG